MWIFSKLVLYSGPFLLTAMASMLGKYPFDGRLLLFVVPLAILGVVEGLRIAAPALNSRLTGTGTALVALVVGGAAFGTVQELRHPLRKEALPEVLDFVAAHKTVNDSVYIYAGAVPAFRYYASRLPMPERHLILGLTRRSSQDLHCELLTLPAGRIWVVLSHGLGDVQTAMLTHLNMRGRPLDSIEAEGAAAFYFDVQAPSAPLATAADGSTPCRGPAD